MRVPHRSPAGIYLNGGTCRIADPTLRMRVRPERVADSISCHVMAVWRAHCTNVLAIVASPYFNFHVDKQRKKTLIRQ